MENKKLSNIIDVTLKYGFESHELFSRALKNFHGIVPKMARTNRTELKNFSRASLNFEVVPSNVLNYLIESRERIKVLAIFRNFNIKGDVDF